MKENSTQTSRITPEYFYSAISNNVFLLMLFLASIMTQSVVQAQTYSTKEYLYINEPAASAVLKYEIGSTLPLTEVTGANGGPHWYPGTGVSELPGPHGLATDLNGKLYIHENGLTGRIRRLTCDGVMDPVSSTTISTSQNYSQNIFSIGNTIYHNSLGGTTAYNSCTGQVIGKLCFAGVSGSNGEWGLSYNPVTETVYATDRTNDNVWVFSKTQLEASIAANPGTCINPLTVAPASTTGGGMANQLYGIVGDDSGNFYAARANGTIYKFNSLGQVIATVNIKPYCSWAIGIVWSSSTNSLYISNYNTVVGEDCISAVDAATMTYTGTAIPNPPGAVPAPAGGSKAIQILRESCPVNLPTAFTRNVCGLVGKKFYLNEEAFKDADGIVCGSSWTPTSMTGMTFDACDNSVTITGEGCGTFTLNIGAVTSTGCPTQTSTFTICNTFPPDITVTTQADCTPDGKYTLTGTVTVAGGAPLTGTLTVRVPGGGSQVFNAPFASVINYSIPDITTTGSTRNVYAEFSDNNCSKQEIYTEPTACPILCATLPNVTASATQPSCSGTNSPDNGGISLTGFTSERYQYTSGSTFTGTPTPAAITVIPAGGVIASTLPNINGSYTVRIYDATDDACYVDRVVNITAAVCCVTPNAGADFTICLPKTTLNLADATSGNEWVAVAGNPTTAVINATTGVITGMTATGVYSFRLQKTGDPSCSDVMTVTVTNGEAPNVLCNDGSTSVTLTAPSNLSNVKWYSMDGTEVGTGNSLVVTSNTGGLADGTEAYYYKGVDGTASGCDVELCCPVKFLTQDCCPTPNCAGVTVIKN